MTLSKAAEVSKRRRSDEGEHATFTEMLVYQLRRESIATPDTILALITRLRAADARAAWQPIEAAPRDGREVLAYGPEWERADVAWYGQGLWWTASGSYDQPTHWMPLPAAPEAQARLTR